MTPPSTRPRPIEQAGGVQENELLKPPSLAAQTQMARHLGKEHRYPDFRLERDVHLGGERKPSQLLGWDPVQGRFWCQGCPGIVFVTGEITEEMVAHAQRFDDGLRPHLTGLYTRAERNEMTRRYLSGDLNRERLRSLQAAGPRRRAAAGKRPEVAERRQRLQEWMLARYVELGVFQRVLDEAERMQELEPERWYGIALCDHLSRVTLSRYWHDIPPPQREAARSDYERRMAARN